MAENKARRTRRTRHSSKLPNALRDALAPLAGRARTQAQKVLLLWPDLIGADAASVSVPHIDSKGHLIIEVFQAAWVPVIEDMESILRKRLRALGCRVRRFTVSEHVEAMQNEVSYNTLPAISVGDRGDEPPSLETTIARLKQASKQRNQQQ